MAGELRAAGFVDPTGFIGLDGDAVAARVVADPASFPTILSVPNANEVRHQIKVMRAEHAMYADSTRRNIDFFERFNTNPPT
jgi:hypothetical protein